MYACLGCKVQCGRCARSIRRIMDEAAEHPLTAGRGGE